MSLLISHSVEEQATYIRLTKLSFVVVISKIALGCEAVYFTSAGLTMSFDVWFL